MAWGVASSDRSDAGRETRPERVATLIGILAHELRTPITTIYAGSAVLARDEAILPAMRQELALDIQAEAARLFRAVEDLLVLTRAEQGALDVVREPVSLPRAVDLAASLEGPRWPGLRVLVASTPGASLVVADTTAVAHVLRNLVADIAWRAEGATDLDIRIDDVGKRVAVRFIDGTGTLEPVDQASYFDLPETEPRAGRQGGSIAVHVAARLIHAMGGDRWIRPLANDHVEIGFSLPRCAPAAA